MNPLPGTNSSLVTSSTYYVDALSGDDAADGVLNPWRSLERVNQQVLAPGDTIRFKSGCRWHGQLRPQGSGSEGHPIRLDRYGQGSLPVIHMGSADGAVLQLTNQEYWEIRHLELTSGAPAGLDHRLGILVLATGVGRVFHHITISECYIHDIWGLLGGPDQVIICYSSTAILVASPHGDRTATYDEVLIEDNHIERVDRNGIIVWTPPPAPFATRVVVRRNRIQNLGGDAILILGSNAALVEYNVVHRSCLRSGDPDLVFSPGDVVYNPCAAAIWLVTCDDSIMQYNEVYDTGKQPTNNDGMAYDLDRDCHRCLVQYNYSRHNQGGFLLIMGTAQDNTIRFNISENDQSHVLYVCTKLAEHNLLHNNIFYRDYGTADIYTGATFCNNIFYAGGQGRYKLMAPQVGVFLHNAYYGAWLAERPEDEEALLADPSFSAAGSGGIGRDSLAGYRLGEDSPCRHTGMLVPAAGGRNFWGDACNDERMDFGA